MQRAWAEGHLAPHDRMETFAEGLATSVPFAVTTELLRDRLDEFRLVSDAALREGVGELFETERIVMEGACAAPLAAMRQDPDRLRGRTVVVPITGRNVDAGTFRSIVGAA
jgi:threonine dehydratase